MLEKTNLAKEKQKQKKKKTPNKNHSKAKQVLVGPRKKIKPREVHYTKWFLLCIDVSPFLQKLKPPNDEHICVFIQK